MNKPNSLYAFVPERELDFKHKILISMKEVMIEEIINNPDGFKLPSGLGTIAITRYVPKRTPFDRQKSKQLYSELKRPVKYNNDHTDGYVMEAVWIKSSATRSVGFKNSRFYSFKATVPVNKAILNQVRINDWRKYNDTTGKAVTSHRMRILHKENLKELKGLKNLNNDH